MSLKYGFNNSAASMKRAVFNYFASVSTSWLSVTAIGVSVCLYVCLCVRSHVSKTTMSKLYAILCHYCLWPWLGPRGNLLCTSDFVDGVTWWGRIGGRYVWLSSPGGCTSQRPHVMHWGQFLPSSIALLVLLDRVVTHGVAWLGGLCVGHIC